MKHLLILTLLCIGFISCEKDNNTTPYPAPTNTNLKYFGYTLVDVGFDDPSDKDKKTNYVDEVAAFTNMADILVTEPTDDIVSRIDNMDANGLKVLIHLNDLIFENVNESSTTLSGNIFALRSDYQSRWDDFIALNNIVANQNKLQAFYLGEEPFWNGISLADLTAASDYIKSTVPNVPIFIVESFAALDLLEVPQSVDWIGFDRYFLADPSTNQNYLDELALLKSKRTNNQKIVLVMDTHWIKKGHGSSGIAKNNMDLVARNYYKLANADTSIVGIINYYWPNGFEKKSHLGARGLPQEVLDEHIRIGKAITGK